MTGIRSICTVCGSAATKACAKCKTPYCSAHCQQEHWVSGHKKECKKIARGGGAEQFHADAEAKKAADAAVAYCAAEGVPQDAECFICKSSIEGKGIVRGCACRGTMGLAHLSCLVWQAETSVKEAEEWNTGEGMRKWHKCFDCGQSFHGAVALALGWACWKMYSGRPEVDWYRFQSVGVLATALGSNGRPEEALPVLETRLALNRRHWSHDQKSILAIQDNLTNCLQLLGRHDEALATRRQVYTTSVETLGASHRSTICSALNLSVSLVNAQLFNDSKSFLRDQLPVARRSLGADHYLTLRVHHFLGMALQGSPGCTRDNLRRE